jgi:hypothetical protein
MLITKYQIILHLFRREHGLEALYQAFERCVGVLSASSVDTDVAVDVCTHIIRCYSVAAQFQVLCTRVVNTFFCLSVPAVLKSGFRIHIHLIRIRIRVQHFRLCTDPDQIRI